MNRLPYDERNARDYSLITQNIDDALEKLKENLNLPATEVVLAKLAGCSRGTLRNRVYPIEKLKEIKIARAEKEDKPRTVRITSAQRIEVNIHIEEKKILAEQLKQSRSEIGVWVNKYFELERSYNHLERSLELLKKKRSNSDAK